MRSDVELENDSLNDRAILYSLNITYTGNSTTQKFTGGGQQCIVCPLKNQKTNECQSCPPGHYLNKNVLFIFKNYLKKICFKIYCY